MERAFQITHLLKLLLFMACIAQKRAVVYFPGLMSIKINRKNETNKKIITDLLLVFGMG